MTTKNKAGHTPKVRMTAARAREILRVHDGSLRGDIVHGLDRETAKHLIRLGYIYDNGAYCLCGKALMR